MTTDYFSLLYIQYIKSNLGQTDTRAHVDIYLIEQACFPAQTWDPEEKQYQMLYIYLFIFLVTWCLHDACAGLRLGARLVALCSDLRWGKAWNHSSWQPHLALLSLSCCPQPWSCKQIAVVMIIAVMRITLFVPIDEMENWQFSSDDNVLPNTVQ